MDFIAQNNNETKRTTVKVFIEPENGSVDATKQLTLDANNFNLSYQEAKTINEEKVKEESYGNANAFWIQRNSDSQIEGFKNISNQIKVKEEQLQQIQKTSANGRHFPLTFLVNYETYQVEKTVEVIISKE